MKESNKWSCKCSCELCRCRCLFTDGTKVLSIVLDAVAFWSPGTANSQARPWYGAQAQAKAEAGCIMHA